VTHTPTRHHVKTVAATSSQPNPEILAICEVVEHPREVFHPCMCELCGGTATVAAVLIGHGGIRSLLG
jgi:hypothetical protein